MGTGSTSIQPAPAAQVASPALHLDRRGDDRRQGIGVSRHTLLGGRRIAARRAEERWGTIPDQHGAVLFLAVASVAMLNILDAFYTVLFLSHGGVELNPFVDWVLYEGGTWAFLLVKSVGIGLCVAFLTVTKNFLVSRVGLAVVLLGYLLLLGWHLSLLSYISY